MNNDVISSRRGRLSPFVGNKITHATRRWAVAGGQALLPRFREATLIPGDRLGYPTGIEPLSPLDRLGSSGRSLGMNRVNPLFVGIKSKTGGRGAKKHRSDDRSGRPREPTPGRAGSRVSGSTKSGYCTYCPRLVLMIRSNFRSAGNSLRRFELSTEPDRTLGMAWVAR